MAIRNVTVRRVTAGFAINTPMFIGDAIQHAARVCSASVKGALAFWWRAQTFPVLFGKSGENRDAALSALQKCEQELFGGPDGQGKFFLKIGQDPAASQILSVGHTLKIPNPRGKPGARTGGGAGAAVSADD